MTKARRYWIVWSMQTKEIHGHYNHKNNAMNLAQKLARENPGNQYDIFEVSHGYIVPLAKVECVKFTKSDDSYIGRYYT